MFLLVFTLLLDKLLSSGQTGTETYEDPLCLNPPPNLPHCMSPSDSVPPELSERVVLTLQRRESFLAVCHRETSGSAGVRRPSAGLSAPLISEHESQAGLASYISVEGLAGWGR